MLSRKTIEILENRNMTVHDRDKQRKEFVREIEFYSPEGEDVNECIFYNGTNEGFIKAFEKNAEDFDVEDHVEVYINIRGTNGVPESIRDLLNDADWIKNTLVETAKELKEVFIKEDKEKQGIRYFEIEFAKKEQIEDNNFIGTPDRMFMCILSKFYPSFEEVKHFCKKDMEEFNYDYICDIKEVSFEEAHEFYDMRNEENFPILTKEPKLKFVTDLTKEQLSELKQSYKTQLLEDSDISYEELNDAKKIPDEVIFNHYKDMTFSDDDFYCSSN